MKVKLHYFKKSGKYYSSGEYDSIHLEYYSIIQEVRDMLQQGNLPDLVEGCTELDVYIDRNYNDYNDQYFPIIIKT